MTRLLHYRPATWRPARLRPFDVGLITTVLVVTAGFRGFDYVTGNDANVRGPRPGVPSALMGIESAFPLYVWGVLILTGVALVVAGMRLKWHAYVWSGHVILSAIYLALCLGLLPAYLDRVWFDGLRSATGLILPFALHTLLWWRMGPRPVDLWSVDADTNA